MRFFTCVLCVLGLCVAEGTSRAQIFRGRFRASCSSGSCSSGSCERQTFTQPMPFNAAPVPDGVIDQGGARVETLPAPKKLPAPAAKPAKPKLVGRSPGPDEEEINFGVDWGSIADRDYRDKDHAVTLAEAIALVKGNYDDAKRNFRLVVIGTKEEMDPFRAAFDKMAAEEKAMISPWFVSADHWSLRDSDSLELRFKVDGKPTVYLLAPDGEVIHRQDGGAPDEGTDAIRKGLKKYDQKRDPDLRKTPDPERAPAVAWRRVFRKFLPVALVCGGACLVLSFISRRQS